MFLPGEQVLFHSAVHYRTRHGFFPAKRRVLILTDLPRLLCIKEYSERSAPGTGGHQAGDIAVKSEMLFSATTSTTRPQILSKISEKSGEAGHGHHPSNEHAVDEEAHADSSTEEATVAPFRARRRSSFLGTGPARPSTIIVKGVENKGDKMFVIRTVSTCKYTRGTTPTFASLRTTSHTTTSVTMLIPLLNGSESWKRSGPACAMKHRSQTND